MRNLLLGAAAFMLVFTSCKKDDNSSSTNNTTTNTSNNTIKVGNTTYTSGQSSSNVLVNYNLIDISGIGNNASVVVSLGFPGNFSGAVAPTAGTYRVVATDSVKKPNEVSFSVVASSGGNPASYYKSTGAGAIEMTVKLTGGKYTFIMPDAPVIGAGGTTGTTGSNTVSLNVTQK